MNYEEIKAVSIVVIMLSALVYSLIMVIYTYRDGYKRLPIIFAMLGIVTIVVITGNMQIFCDVIFNTFYTNIEIFIIDIIAALLLPIAVYISMFCYNEKASILFFSIAISMFIVSVLIL
jgi:hypothetical protein